MIILAIDGSTKSTGYAVIQNNKILKTGCITNESLDTITRIEHMKQSIKQVIEEYHPTDVVIEDILPEDVRSNQKTFKALIYLQAALAFLCHDHKLTPTLYTASHWRALVGIHTGRGVKREQLKTASIQLVEKIYGLKVNDDVADAINLGFAYYKENASAF